MNSSAISARPSVRDAPTDNVQQRTTTLYEDVEQAPDKECVGDAVENEGGV